MDLSYGKNIFVWRIGSPYTPSKRSMRNNKSLMRLLSSLKDEMVDEDDDELGFDRVAEGDWTEESQGEDQRTAESRAALRNLLGRFWVRKKDNVQLVPPPENNADNDNNANNPRKQLPQWLREQQEERSRIRQIGKDEKRLESQLEQQQFNIDQRAVVSTTGNVKHLMQGMPSLNDMFGESAKNDNTEKDVELQEDFIISNNSSVSDEDDVKSSLPRLSTSGEISRTQLGERMKSLLEETAVGSSSSSYIQQYNYSAAVEATAMEATAGFKEDPSSIPSTIADQRYRSFRKLNDDTSGRKRSQFDHFLQQEQQLRQKMGLTGSLFEKEQEEKVHWMAEQERKKSSQASESLAPEERDSISASIQSEKEKEKFSSEVDEGLKTKFIFDEYGTDPSFAEWKPKTLQTTIEDARYRSFSAAKATKDSKDAFESFLKKEKEMREKLGMERTEEASKENITADGTGTPTNKWSEVENLYLVEHSDDKATDNDDEEDLGNYEEDDMDKFKPKPMSIADLRFRSLAKQSSSDDDDKKAQFKEFLKKEQLMRQKLGYDSISVDDADVIVEEEQHPHSPFFDEDEVVKNQFRQQQRTQPQLVGLKTDSPPPSGGTRPPSSMWNALEDLYAAKHSSEDDEVLKEYEDIAADLFVRGNRRSMRTPILSERSTFSSFEARKRDLLENTELTVEELDLLFEFDPLSRLSTINKPDSAFGAIFRFEGKNVIQPCLKARYCIAFPPLIFLLFFFQWCDFLGCLVDTTELQLAAWTKTAREYQFRLPDREEVSRAMLMQPEVAIRNEFFWTTDILESRDVALTHHDKLEETFDEMMKQINVTKVEWGPHEVENTYYMRDEAIKRYRARYLTDYMNTTTAEQLFPVAEGAKSWLHRIKEVEMPCSVISHLDSTKLETLLNITGLSEYFNPKQHVSSCVGYTREEQEYLGAALRMNRRPDHCVVFSSTPESSIRAHEVKIKAISIMGLYPMYELQTADLSVSAFDDLSVVNVRRVFSDKSFEPEVQLMLERPMTKPRPIRTWVEGDRN